MAAYSGNDEGYWLSVSISNNEAILGNDMQNLWVGDVEVDFTNGVGSGTFESLD